jgi:two-component system response regulator (stage 0 sporulation protein A)
MDRQENIRQILLDIGVPQHIKGYAYLKTAINLVVEDSEKVHAVTKVLYPEVAKVHGTTTSRVERAIRHAVESAFNHIDPDTIKRYFGYSIDMYRGKPTNSHFISAVAEIIAKQ